MKERPWAPVAWIVVGAAVLRLAFLALWPEAQADEGLWTIGVKNFVQFGDWFHDGRSHFLLSPAFHLLTAPLFEVLGPGIHAARLLSGAAGAATVPLIVVLVERATGHRRVALVAGGLAAVNEFAVLLSRTALVESLELFMIVGTAVALTAGTSRKRVWGTALMMALALLTKLNSGFFVVVAAAAILLSKDGILRPGGQRSETRWVTRLARTTPLLLGVVFAAIGYGALYLWQPDRFLEAFVFEMEVGDRVAVQPLFSIGRFALAPAESAETVLELIRQMPFLTVLASMGLALRAWDGFDEDQFFLLWLALGGAFFLLQVYQPQRYAYLFLPPLVYFAAVAMDVLGAGLAGAGVGSEESRLSHLADRRRRLGAVLAVYFVFELAYIGAGVATNRGIRLEAVERFGRSIPDSARLVGAPYLCVNLRQECLPHYGLLGEGESATKALEELEIDYAIVDEDEWSLSSRRAIDLAYTTIATWSFGAAYRLRDPEGRTEFD